MEQEYSIRAKLFHYVLADRSTKSKHKGISSSGIKTTADSMLNPSLPGNLLTDDEQLDPITLLYRDCLFEGEVHYAKNVDFRTKNHIISLVETVKKATSLFDDKRWILQDGVRTLPYGHWRIDA